MAKLAKFLQGVAGAGGGEALNVEDVFSTYLYDGTGSAQTITNGIDLAGEGGLVWIKNRNEPTGSYNHSLVDTERGNTYHLRSNSTLGQIQGTQGLTSFNSDGFSIGSAGDFNTNTYDMVSWTFRKAPKFFDVVTYTGDGVDGRTISHNLGSTPGMIIVKRLDSADGWIVYHREMDATSPEDYAMFLNLTNARATETYWDNTAPTSTGFTVSSNVKLNGSGGTYVAYLFAHNDGDASFGPDADQDIIKCGSFTTDASENATVDLGWEPQFVIFKETTRATNWLLMDTMRGAPVGGVDARLEPDGSGAEVAGNDFFDPTPTGFIAKGQGNTKESIYIAIRRGPMAVPTDATEVFDIAFDGALDTNKPYIRSDLNYVDMAINSSRTGTTYHRVGSRLTQGTYLDTNSTSAETTSSYYQYDFQNGWFDLAASNSINTNGISWMWKRAPNFFDVVAWEGDGTTDKAVNHNLTVPPEMIWFKNRDDGTESWYVPFYGVSGITDGNAGLLNGINTVGGRSMSTQSPTSDTVYFGGTSGIGNTSGDSYIAYLFASLGGVSKIGTYTGNGSSQTIDCGFSSGARFILVKRVNFSTGDWYVWDTERGVVAGNDPHLSLNSTAAEVTTDDSIDPVSSGFAVNQVSATNINVSGSTYIFYAIA